MDFESSQREFNVRYYRWGLRDWEREIGRNLPFLRGFKSGPAWQVADMMSGMDTTGRLFFARALAKRFHREAVRVLGEQITPEEQRVISQYRERVDMSPDELALHERELRGERNVYASGQALRRALRAGVARLNLEPIESTSTLWQYATRLGRWDVITRIQTTGRQAQVRYDHDIVLADERERVVLDGGQVVEKYICLARFICLESWLGISSQTEWYDLVESDLRQVAKSLVALCAHFLEAVPGLLRGL